MKATPNTPPIVRKVAVTETLAAMPRGTSATFRAREFAPISSVYAAASRLNAASGRKAYEVSTDDNGETYTINHN